MNDDHLSVLLKSAQGPVPEAPEDEWVRIAAATRPRRLAPLPLALAGGLALVSLSFFAAPRAALITPQLELSDEAYVEDLQADIHGHSASNNAGEAYLQLLEGLE